MLEPIIHYSIHHKLIVLLFSAGIVGFGLYSVLNCHVMAVSGKTAGGKFNIG